ERGHLVSDERPLAREPIARRADPIIHGLERHELLGEPALNLDVAAIPSVRIATAPPRHADPHGHARTCNRDRTCQPAPLYEPHGSESSELLPRCIRDLRYRAIGIFACRAAFDHARTT